MSMDDSKLWRPKPPSSYRPSKKVTRVTLGQLTATVRALRSVPRGESACLWLGQFHDGGDATVAAIVIPKQVSRPRNYSIPTAAMQEVAALARPQGWTVVAAIHSHPGDNVEHSVYDDQMTPSRRALSLVFANYGACTGEWPQGVGVHEFIDDYWHLLPAIDKIGRAHV